MIALRQLATAVAKETRVIVRDRQALAILFVMPVVFVTILSLALRDVFTERAGATFDVLIVNQDPGPVGQKLTASFTGDPPLPGHATDRGAGGRRPHQPGDEPIPPRRRLRHGRSVHA